MIAILREESTTSSGLSMKRLRTNLLVKGRLQFGLSFVSCANIHSTPSNRLSIFAVARGYPPTRSSLLSYRDKTLKYLISVLTPSGVLTKYDEYPFLKSCPIQTITASLTSEWPIFMKATSLLQIPSASRYPLGLTSSSWTIISSPCEAIQLVA